jgi:catechol-2,3-dioxygenase
MSINHLHHVTLTVPDVDAQKNFYEDFGLIGKSDTERAILQCKGRNQDQVIVVPGHGMGLHNISFGTTTKGLSEIEKRIRRSADVTSKNNQLMRPTTDCGSATSLTVRSTM